MSMNQEQQYLTTLLAPLIVFIVFVIVVTLFLHVRVTKEKDPALQTAPVLEMRLDKSPPQFLLHHTGPRKTGEEQTLLFPKVEEILSTAHYEYSEGLISQAAERLRTALVFYPDHKKILHLLGSIYYKQKENAKAENVYRYLIRNDKNDWLARNNLAAVLASQSRYKEAIREAEISYQQDNSPAVTVLNLASIYAQNKDKAKALQYFKEAYDKLGSDILSFSSNPNFDLIRREETFRRIIHEAQKRRSKNK